MIPELYFNRIDLSSIMYYFFKMALVRWPLHALREMSEARNAWTELLRHIAMHRKLTYTDMIDKLQGNERSDSISSYIFFISLRVQSSS